MFNFWHIIAKTCQCLVWNQVKVFEIEKKKIKWYENSSKTSKIFTNNWKSIIDSLLRNVFPFLNMNLFLPPQGGLARIFTLSWSFLNDTLIFHSRLRDYLQIVFYESLKDFELSPCPSHNNSDKWQESFSQLGFYKCLDI